MIGGAAATEGLWGGYRVSTASHVMGLLQPKVILDLELPQFGFEVLPLPPSFHQLANGHHLVGWPKMDRLCAEFARFSVKDAEAYPEYCSQLRRVAPIMRRLLWEILPDPGFTRISDLKDLLLFTWRFRDIRSYFHDVYDLFTLSAFDYLSRWLTSMRSRWCSATIRPALPVKASAYGHPARPICCSALICATATRPAEFRPARGGMGRIADALASSGKRHGMEVRTNAEVGSIIVRNGRAEGVALRSGDEIAAKVVIANADAKTTFLNLLEPSTLPADFVRHIRNFRAVSTAFKIHLAVDRLPTYPNFDSSALGFDYPAQVRIAPSVEYMERAYDDVRQGRMSRRPYLTVLAPTVVDFNIGAGGRSYPQYLRRPRAAGSAERARGADRRKLFSRSSARPY